MERAQAAFAGLSVLALCAGAPTASAQITYLSQARTITASTTSNGNIVQASAQNFLPFVETVTSSTVFNGPNGPVLNEGTTTIDSDLNPNTIRGSGHCAGSGGTDDEGMDEFGEGEAQLDVTFEITQPTTFTLFSLPRPSTLPRDEFEIELINLTTTTTIVDIDETQPAQFVNVSGVLTPGVYSLHYEVEFSSNGPGQSVSYLIEMRVGTGACDHVDFNHDGMYPDIRDIEDFLSVFAGSPCAPPSPPVCNDDTDFNNDGLSPDQLDVEALLRVFAGGACE